MHISFKFDENVVFDTLVFHDSSDKLYIGCRLLEESDRYTMRDVSR
jgi:hypothetical protein